MQSETNNPKSPAIRRGFFFWWLCGKLKKNSPFGYCGEYRDKETGEIYLRARYYNPVVGRFLAEDPARSGGNWYGYCSGDPVNKVDPFGLFMTDAASRQEMTEQEGTDGTAMTQPGSTAGYRPSTQPSGTHTSTPSVVKLNPPPYSGSTNYMTSYYSWAGNLYPYDFRNQQIFIDPTRKPRAVFNNVRRRFVKVSFGELNMGSVWGRVGVSATTTYFESEPPGLINVFAEQGGLTERNGVSLDLGPVAKFNAGHIIENNLGTFFLEVQATPWLHAEVSAGKAGLGITVGVIENSESSTTSYDFEMEIGPGAVMLLDLYLSIRYGVQRRSATPHPA